MTVATKITEEIMFAPEGGTASLEGWELPHHGYFVGGRVPALVLGNGAEFTPDAIQQIKIFLRRLSDVRVEYVGWWTDEETGKVYIDGTDWFEDRSTAERLGRERHELAIYDISGERDIRFVYVDGE